MKMMGTHTLYHRPIMSDECMEGLNIHPEGVYVDATFGGGGHSLTLLERVKGGRLIAFDRDGSAEQEAKRITHSSFTFHRANFMHIKKYLRLEGITKVNGILIDLGVSSHQIDTPERGFSTRYDGPLDMRMDENTSLTASRVLNEYPETRLCEILSQYGEIRNARTLARLIVRERENRKFIRNKDLIDRLKTLVFRGREYKYYAQVFQALRIEVNKELEALETFLTQCEELIECGGRLVAISYHSLEDRMVKNLIYKGKTRGELEKDLYGHPVLPFKTVHRKPILPQKQEIVKNNRARSAKMRVAERECKA